MHSNRGGITMYEQHWRAARITALALCLIAAAIAVLSAGRAQADGGLTSPFQIIAHDPPANAVGVPLNANVQATFDGAVIFGTVHNGSFVVHGNLGGLAGGTFTYDDATHTVTLDPDRAFHAGEVLRVSATDGIKQLSYPIHRLTPYGWQFTAGPVVDRRFAGFADIGAGLVGVEQSSVAWGDYDNDGDLDILLTGWDGSIPVSKVYRNDDGAFTDIGAGPTGVAISSVAWGDYDNDGDLDILLTGYDGSTRVSKVCRNDGGAFTDIGAGLTGVSFSSVAWGDYDNDGDLDILLTGQDHTYNPVSKVCRNDGGGAFTDIGAGLTSVGSSSVAWGDHDNDGDLDILLTGWTGSAPVSEVYRNDGGGAFMDIGAGLTGVEDGAVAWGDYDNDGDLDILLTGYDGSTRVSKVYRNEGASWFTDIGAGLTGVEDGAVAWGDYDNDGDLDILLTGYDYDGSTSVSKVYRNDGGGSFTDVGAGLTGVFDGSVAWGDYDDDGDLDILLTGRPHAYSRVSKVYRNNSTPAVGAVTPSSGSGATGVTTYFTTTWSDQDGWENLKQCYFHIGDSPALAGNVTLLYNAAKDRLWLLDDSGTTWQGGCHPGDAQLLGNGQAGLICLHTLVQGGGDTLSVRWALQFYPGFEGGKKLGLKCKDRDKAKAKGKWKGTWTLE